MPFDATPITTPEIELLEKVYRLLKAKDWIQGQEQRWLDEKGYVTKEPVGFCLIGAFAYSRKEKARSYEAKQEFSRLLGFRSVNALTNWNDDDRRTKRGVLQRLRYRINKLKAQAINVSLLKINT